MAWADRGDMARINRRLFVLLAFSLAAAAQAQGTTHYVSAARGKGKKATKEEPARDLGVIADQLKAGDTVLIAGGTYLGRGDSGSDQITVPVTILGGWNDDFTQRDPWGTTKTVLTGDNKSKNWNRNARLWLNCRGCKESAEIVVDGVIVDHGPRNYYVKEGDKKIVRKANPSTGNNATPETPGISIDTHRGGKATVRNCVVMNTASTGGSGAIYAFGGENSTVVIENNLVINNTGNGINCVSSWHPRDNKGMPTFTVTNNTVLFNWKYDAYATHGGTALKMDSDAVIAATGNVFAFNDFFGVDNIKRSKELTMVGNLFGPSLAGDYMESAVCSVKEFDETPQLLGKATTGNVAEKFQLQLNEPWAVAYAARTVIDRNKAEADVQPANDWQNDLRGMLGISLQAADLKADSDVWLHRITVDDAVAVGLQRVLGRYGCQDPSSQAEGAAQPIK